jgi:hypothetical protein
MTLVPAADLAELGPPNGAFLIVVMLNWNNVADTLECAESVLRSDYPRFAVWGVDNGSDGIEGSIRNRGGGEPPYRPGPEPA